MSELISNSNPGNVIYYQLKEGFARQMAEYYRLSGDDENIPHYRLPLCPEEIGQDCRLFSADEMRRLLKTGIQNLIVEPEQVYLWHRTSAHWSSYPMRNDDYNHLLSLFSGQDYWLRYQTQKPFREAWEKELISERGSVEVLIEDSGDQDSAILKIVGQATLFTCLSGNEIECFTRHYQQSSEEADGKRLVKRKNSYRRTWTAYWTFVSNDRGIRKSNSSWGPGCPTRSGC